MSNTNDTIDFGDDFNEMFGSDKGTESSGTWFPVPNKPGWEIKLRCQHSPEWRDFVAKQQKRYAPLFAAGKPIPAVEVDKDRVEALAKVGVLDWKGFGGLEFNAFNVRRVMEQFAPFRDFCMATSSDRTNFQQSHTKELGETSPQ